MGKLFLCLIVSLSLIPELVATTWYVDATVGDDANVGSAQMSPFKSIQKAIDVAAPNDMVRVNDGTYGPIVSSNKCIRIESANGAKRTIIRAAGSYLGGVEERCATLSDINEIYPILDGGGSDSTESRKTVLVGFCLQGGEVGEWGGGVFGGTLIDCVIEECYGQVEGGGACGSSMTNCVVRKCGSYFGSGTFYCDCTSCLIVDNSAGPGAGTAAFGGTLVNCTIANNTYSQWSRKDEWMSSVSQGYDSGVAGLDWCDAVNCIVYSNVAYCIDHPEEGSWAADVASRVTTKSCWISKDPNFIDVAHGDYRVLPTSPCVDNGATDVDLTEKDVGGRPRIVNGRVDIGAYELQQNEVDGRLVVEFDLGGHATRVGGGELSQAVKYGEKVVAPEFVADNGWLFIGWDMDFSWLSIGCYKITALWLQVCTVTFDLGDHCHRTGGGELVQVCTNNCAVYPPEVGVDEGWIFVDWNWPTPSACEDATITPDCRKLADNVEVLSGSVKTSRTLSADMTYVVKGTVSVLSTVQLEIPVGTVVKFMPNSSLMVLNGATCLAKGVVFTHVADDTVGGDTLLDGNAMQPEQDKYWVKGVTDDDTTEYRYFTKPTVTLSGTIVKDEAWSGHQVYHVTGNLTIQNGVTLTVDPGAIVKFDAGRSLTVSSGGTLNAIGTRAQPIVFTSIKDDDWGGDTNGDGDATKAAAGDWARIYAGGTVNMTFCRVANCNNNGDNGAIHGTGGKVTLNNCLLERSVYELVRMNSGSFVAYNCIFRDASMGFGYFGGSGTKCYNCVIADVSEGVRASNKYFYNCIFYRVLNFGSAGNSYNCCFYNPPDYVNSAQSFSSVGRNGNFWADPKFKDPANGDFSLQDGSPCIDAGNGSYAPATDYYGQTRQTVDAETAKGTKAANGNYPDIGIYEVMPGDVKADVDLTVTSVTAPATMRVGDEVTVSWTVKNAGTAYAAGLWRDKAEIVCVNGTVVELGETTVSASLAPGAEQGFSAKWTVPSAQTGSVRVRVTTNAERDIFEGTLVANNACLATDETELSLPQCDIPADGSSATLAVSGRAAASYALGTDFAAGGFLVVRSSGKIVARTGNGQVPTADTYYGASIKVTDDTWLVSVPEGGQAYLVIENEGEATADVEIAYQKGEFALYDTGESVTYTKGFGNDLVLTVYGNGFAGGGGHGVTALPGEMSVALVGAGTVIEAADVTVSGNGTVANVTFAESSCLAGDYHLRLAKSGQTIVQDGNPITIKNRATGILPKPAELEYSLEMLSTVRQGREYMGYIVYGNKGKGAGTAPYLRVTASNGSQVRFSQSDAWSTELELMGISQTYPASQVKAGESVKVPFYYMTSGTSAEVKLGVATAADGDFPWETNGRYMRPSWASDEFWELAFAILKANVGTTWGDWIKRMRYNSDYMMKLGKPTYRLEPLWQLEVNEALGVDHAVSTLAGGTDLARSGRGMGLALRRSYGAAFYSRFKRGLFGYGWSDNYSVWAELQDSGATLAIHSGDGSTYRFYKTNGVWTPEDARDKTKVNETSDEYVLTYRSGTVQRIGKSNMHVASIADNQGNEIAFTYFGKFVVGGGVGANIHHKLVHVEHTDGQALDFAYDDEGRIVSATDDQGRTVSYAYDGDLLVAVTAFNGLVTRYSYYPADGTPTSRALRQIVYPDGNTKDFTYDAAGRVATSAVNGNLMMTEIVRGEFGSYKTIAPNGGVSSVSVGAAGEVLETVNALGQKVTRTYTDDTLLESMVGPTGKRSKIAYDADGNAVKATDAAGASTTFAYTSDFGSLAKVTDARGNSFNYGYDKLGRSEQIGYADNSMERIEYSDRGDITNSVNRRGQSVAYTYDREGNVLSEVWETGRTLTWEYDAKGNCTRATDSETGAVTMEYDANERLSRIAYPNGHGFTYAYDAFGHVTARTSFDGFAQKYEYDALGRLAKLTDGDGNPFLENVYDETTGQLWLMKYGNGTIVSNSYDILGRTIGIYHLVGSAPRADRTSDATPVGSAPRADRLAFFEYAYDAEGRRISQTTAEGVERYTYDTAGQLTDVTYPDGTEEHFRYDAVGNRLSANGDTYEVNNLNQYTSVGSAPRADRTSFEYDLDGNMTKRIDSTGTTEYFYDLQNRLVAVSNETADIRWACVYDVFGNRVKVIDHGTVTEKVFVQGALPSVAEEYSGTTLKKRKIGMGSTSFAAIEGGNVSYSHEDGRMSTCVVSDADGKVKSTCAVKAFGEARVGNAHNFVDMLGVEYDDATGLYFMRNRYYDAGLGRFVQVDPISIYGGLVNLYCYCSNDAVSYSDFDGMEAQPSSSQYLKVIDCQEIQPRGHPSAPPKSPMNPGKIVKISTISSAGAVGASEAAGGGTAVAGGVGAGGTIVLGTGAFVGSFYGTIWIKGFSSGVFGYECSDTNVHFAGIDKVSAAGQSTGAGLRQKFTGQSGGRGGPPDCEKNPEDPRCPKNPFQGINLEHNGHPTESTGQNLFISW